MYMTYIRMCCNKRKCINNTNYNCNSLCLLQSVILAVTVSFFSYKYIQNRNLLYTAIYKKYSFNSLKIIYILPNTLFLSSVRFMNYLLTLKILIYNIERWNKIHYFLGTCIKLVFNIDFKWKKSLIITKNN